MEHSGWDWIPLAITRAWNYQLGARAQWLGPSRDLIVFNDRFCAANTSSDDLCAQIYNISSRARVRELPRPVFAVSPDGSQAAAVCMKRLEVASPGWGYPVSAAGVAAATAARHPLHDGLWLTDVETGKGRLLVSLRQLHEMTTTGATCERPATDAAVTLTPARKFTPGLAQHARCRVQRTSIQQLAV